MPVLPHISDILVGHHVLPKRLAVPLPAYQSKNDMNPTLLVSWFCTILSVIIIFIRLLGRWVRNERLFSEDKVMFWSIIPLLGRMGFVHVILIWGTNNTVAYGLSEVQVQHRVIGSKLVLPARMFFATYIWLTKVTILEFLQKLVAQSWHKSYVTGMRIVYGLLGATYVAVVISTLAGCHPFDHYWQVIPDPGTACRAGIAQLITMGACEIVTDLVLVIFPIPLVLSSGMVLKQKVSLISLFLLSLVLVAITAYRVPSTIERGSSQQYRSLLASLEVLASTAVANAIVIGSFLRDKGIKKAKFRAESVGGSTLSRVPTQKTTRSRSIAQHHWGSDEDLVREMGLALPPELRHGSNATEASQLPPIAEVVSLPSQKEDHKPRRPTIDTNWTFNKSRTARRRRSDVSSLSSSSTADIKLHELRTPIEDSVSPGGEVKTRKMSFFETGEMLDSPYVSSHPPPEVDTSKSQTFLSDVGGLLSGGHPKSNGRVPYSSEPNQVRSSLHPHNARRDLQDITPSSQGSRPDRRATQEVRHVSKSPLRNGGPDDLDLADAGGLLK